MHASKYASSSPLSVMAIVPTNRHCTPPQLSLSLLIMIYPFHYLFSILAYCSLLHTVLGTPLPYDSHNGTSPSYSLGHTGLEALVNRQAKDKPLLRLLPLGASITRGTNSNPVNGYRKNLRDELRFLGYPVNMVGCMAEGDFNDNQHEGHPGWFISQVATA
jgi:hypothetical protein